MARTGTIHTEGAIVSLNKCNVMVNTIDPMRSKFDSQISVRGSLSIDGTRRFDRILSHCGGTIEVEGFFNPL